MYRFPLSSLIYLLLADPVGAQEAPRQTAAWMTHPEIAKVRQLYDTIQAEIGRGNYSGTSRQVLCARATLEATLFEDSSGAVRKFALTTGTQETPALVWYFYDADGTLRFTFQSIGTETGRHQELRSYFDEGGDLLYHDLQEDGESGFQIRFPQMVVDPRWAFRFQTACQGLVFSESDSVYPRGCRSTQTTAVGTRFQALTRARTLLEFLMSSAPTDPGSYDRERGGNWDLDTLLGFISRTGLTIYDVNKGPPRDLPPDELRREISQSGEARFSLLHLAYIYSIPYPQYSNLLMEIGSDCAVLLIGGHWGYALYFGREEERLMLRRLDYLTIEGH